MKKHFLISIILLTFLFTMPADAKMKKLGQAGLSFLNISGSARAAGMADVFTFAKNDLASVFYNTAGLATVEKRAFFFNLTNWIADMSVANMAVSWNTPQYGTFALHAQVMDYGTINGTVISDTDPRGYSDVEVGTVSGLSVGLGYGISMTDKFSIGGNIKYVSQNLGQNDTYVGDAVEFTGKVNSVNGIAFDFGTMYDTGIRSVLLTMTIRNYSRQMLYENEEFQIPQTYRIGLAAELFELFTASRNATHSATLALEAVDPVDRPEYVNFGVEYSMIDMLSLRVGWATQRAQDGTGGLSAGAGFKLNTSGFAGRIDLSYSSHGAVLGSVTRLSLQGAF